ncbi:hypothetical protein PVV74_17985 [Roseovarius sp. SK2]|uniref:DUF6902 family protein n=1 Tax=Roseovarius TaxID=74030 RepID=UPI00237A9541|nr:hypothetical protein [Roseovarius sp. SK2]MDD9727354.1 hypothetical protein [Roseovarius sp. SK2]
MGSVVTLDLPFRQTTRDARQTALLQRFACERRPDTDVFWLKENAEVLNILTSTGAKLPLSALAPFDPHYITLDRKLAFFPQYYRFLLSLCLDLEDLGMPGDMGARSVEWVAFEGLVHAELSDLQRAEARRLCLRRGIDPTFCDSGLDDRLRGFGSRSATFTLPNKKAAYELTHIVFYLSEYGHRDPDLPAVFIDSLRFAGTVAFLEMNIDLLAEICIALRFSGQTPPDTWESWLAAQARHFVIEADATGWVSDDYHPYLMVQWFLSTAGLGGFGTMLPEGGLRITAPRPHVAPLRELSECMYRLEGDRIADWSRMRTRIDPLLTAEAREVVEAAEKAVDFDAFFHGFSRAATVKGIPA